MIIDVPIKIERTKEILPYIINANSHRGIILSLLSKFRKDAERGYTYTPLELKQVFEEALTRYNELKKENDIFNVVYSVVGWKGKDLPEIFDNNEEFELTECRKDKLTGEVETLVHRVPHSKVNHLLKFIRTWKINDVKDCYAFSEYLGYSNWKDLWKERKIYFEDYYFPIKVIESLKLINYGSKGKIKRIK